MAMGLLSAAGDLTKRLITKFIEGGYPQTWHYTHGVYELTREHGRWWLRYEAANGGSAWRFDYPTRREAVARIKAEKPPAPHH